ncbi:MULTISPECIES: ribonuclease D [unclassified Coleofasciculus]|uniref:ribonuclease D n=1 Tax=unclassified Coleofasciculus TaxID=2692782 RepID=UPI00187EF6CF|nr:MULTISPECIES: ribonuclease D [unclassified Coleofasciculus]MBE9128420.1 ribonuclease D [Coleofasciculus sp. LEGE 07081]MBE9149535.1 ribonuclease D [Coleofasciculus sp. LEGE 07092]
MTNPSVEKKLADFQVCDRDLTEALCQDYLTADAIAVDTETMGLIYQRDRLCLVQLCDSKGRVTVIRIAKGQTEAPNLKKLLEATNILKVFHFARFDLGMLRQNLGIQVQPIFCTKIASKLARTYTNRHGLKELVLELEQVELDKGAQSSDWGNPENLSDGQLQYAANDVRYLVSLQQKLVTMLKREDRWKVAQQCFELLPIMVTLDLLQYRDIFEH